jgi:plasmid stabilization system protein ParE/plasmid stability protein
MSDLRIRGLDEELVETFRHAAELNGRSLESELRYRLEELGRTSVADFPTATDWLREGFDEVLELAPRRQYIAIAREQQYRVTLTRSMTGGDPEWNTDIEECVALDGRSSWMRSADIATRSHGNTAAFALRDCIRALAKYAGNDAVSRARKIAEGFNRLPVAYKRIINGLDGVIVDGVRELRDRSVVIWRTPQHEIYVNIVDEKRGALMVYPLGGGWSITNGKAMYFPIDSTAVTLIRDELVRLSVLG